jgi:16S rRNA (cytosine967-C5)-methyltransferase
VTAPGLPARAAAAALIESVLDRGCPLGELTDAADGPLSGLATAERARAQSLTLATLRHIGAIDRLLKRFLARPPQGRARTALRLATTELMTEGVPPHAAVDSAVRLTRADRRSRHLAGLVNAVARRVAAEGAAAWQAAPARLPAWIADPVRTAWGAGALAAIERAHAAGAPLDLTLRDAAAASRWSGPLAAEPLPTGSLRRRSPAQVSALPGYAEGAWWVQDAAAALPARLLPDPAGRRVLDLCAAPGGKTLQLAAAGARVTALDISTPRLERLRTNLARTGLAAEIVAADALAWSAAAPVDAVLLDAPCTGTGTIRRHPDLPFVRRPDDLPPLVALQDRLLDAAWSHVAPGGHLVFCTCSLLPAEGEERVAAFLSRCPDARQLAPDPARLGIPPVWIDAAGGLRTRPDFWPELGGVDGFHAALLVRSEDAVVTARRSRG